MSNRNNIKWQPFNAVASGTYMINEVLKEKNKIQMPELSDEQIKNLENSIKDSFFTQETIIITYFQNGILFNKNGIVKNIDTTIGKITLNDGFSLFFKQILNINKF